MRILLATDGSPSARTAVELVAQRPWEQGTAVRLLAVDDAYGAARDEQERHLHEAAAELTAAGLVTDSALHAGRAASVLLAEAAQSGADLLVLGNRGRSRMQSLLLGSVSAEVVERARCSVMVVRSARVERLLLAVDGSPPAREVPRFVCAAGAFFGSEALVISVSRSRSPWPPNLDERAARAATRAAAQLRQCGLAAEREVIIGDPAPAIVDRATTMEADLVAVGSRGMSRLRRLLLGSVARNVVSYAPCSVLVVRRASGR